MTTKVSIEDLTFGLDWLDSFEGGPNDVNFDSCQRLKGWIEAEIIQRKVEAAMRASNADIAKAAKDVGVPVEKFRKRFRERATAEITREVHAERSHRAYYNPVTKKLTDRPD